MAVWSIFFGLLILLVPLAYLLASLVGLSYLWYRVLIGKRSGDLPTCARCGYGVRGLAGLICPECGSDLREVGITTPKQRGAVSPILFVLLWTLLLPGPGCVISGILVAVGPKSNVNNGMLTLEPVVTGQYLTIEIDQMSMPSFFGGNMSSLTVQGTNSQYEYLDIDPVNMTYDDWSSTTINSPTSTSVSVNAGNQTKPLNQQAVLDMLKRAGADITQQHVIGEADEVVSIIQGIPTQGLANLTPTQFTVQNYFNNSYGEPAGWFMLLLLGLWVLIWVLGLVYFFRVRAKQFTGAHPDPSDPPRFAPPSPPPPSAPAF